MPSHLRALLDLITAGVDEIEAAYAGAGEVPPSLDTLYAPSKLEKELTPVADRVAAAAYQLMCTVRRPVDTVGIAALGVRAHHCPSTS